MMAKGACIVVISCFVGVIISFLHLESFADENARRQRDINDPQPFRLNKLNIMWEKAKKVIMAFHIRHFAIWGTGGFDKDWNQ